MKQGYLDENAPAEPSALPLPIPPFIATNRYLRCARPLGLNAARVRENWYLGLTKHGGILAGRGRVVNRHYCRPEDGKAERRIQHLHHKWLNRRSLSALHGSLAGPAPGLCRGSAGPSWTRPRGPGIQDLFSALSTARTEASSMLVSTPAPQRVRPLPCLIWI